MSLLASFDALLRTHLLARPRGPETTSNHHPSVCVQSQTDMNALEPLMRSEWRDPWSYRLPTGSLVTGVDQ